MGFGDVLYIEGGRNPLRLPPPLSVVHTYFFVLAFAACCASHGSGSHGASSDSRSTLRSARASSRVVWTTTSREHESGSFASITHDDPIVLKVIHPGFRGSLSSYCVTAQWATIGWNLLNTLLSSGAR